MRVLTALGVIVLVSASAGAQQPAQNPPTPTDKATYFSGADLTAGLSKLPSDRPSGSVRIFTFAPYNLNVEQRQPVAQGASIHETYAELFHVLEGSGTLVTGGTIPNATKNGTNLTGKTIEGGVSQKLGKGDWMIVPSGVPHQFVDVQGPLKIMSLNLPNAK
jgi:mannose-6-phosphate isomerase-like protein (cupin superfamily)